MISKAFLVDLDRCVGCYACIIGCKDENDLEARVNRINLSIVEGKKELYRFYIPEFNLEGSGGHESRCTMCPQLQVDGKSPACVSNCLTDAILFDEHDRIQELTKSMKHVKKVKTGKTTVFYGSSKSIPQF